MADARIIAQLKKQYKDVYSTSLAGTEYIFRALTFKEFDNLIIDNTDMIDAEEEVIGLTVLYPEEVDIDKMKAGAVTSLADEIISSSGFTDIETAQIVLNEKRSKMQSFRSSMKAFVLAAYPTIIEEDLDDLTFSELAEKVAMAERVLTIRQMSMGVPDSGLQLDIVDPKAEEEADRRSQDFSKLSKDPDAKSTLGTARIDDPIAQKLWAALQQ